MNGRWNGEIVAACDKTNERKQGKMMMMNDVVSDNEL